MRNAKRCKPPSPPSAPDRTGDPSYRSLLQEYSPESPEGLLQSTASVRPPQASLMRRSPEKSSRSGLDGQRSKSGNIARNASNLEIAGSRSCFPPWYVDHAMRMVQPLEACFQNRRVRAVRHGRVGGAGGADIGAEHQAVLKFVEESGGVGTEQNGGGRPLLRRRDLRRSQFVYFQGDAVLVKGCAGGGCLGCLLRQPLRARRGTLQPEPTTAMGEAVLHMLRQWLETGNAPDRIPVSAELIRRGSIRPFSKARS